ncbi:MAG: hypothetical protein ACYSXF_01990, partial [Planctomycetota bacterium]
MTRSRRRVAAQPAAFGLSLAWAFESARLLVLAAGLLTAASLPAHASDIIWDGNSDGDGDGHSWSDGFNWSGNYMPDFDDRVIFDAIGGPITLDIDPTNQKLEIRNAHVTFDSFYEFHYTATESVRLAPWPGHDSRLTVLGGWLMSNWIEVADDGIAVLTVAETAHVECNELNVGSETGSHGTVLVEGERSEIFVSTQLFIGSVGVGELIISDSGLVVCVGTSLIGLDMDEIGSGSVTITGANSALYTLGWLNIGFFSQGAVQISDGGFVSSET